MKIIIKVSDNLNTSWLTITDGKVFLRSPSETPLALSNEFGEKAAELRFHLAVATSPEEALKMCRNHNFYNKDLEIWEPTTVGKEV